MRLIRGISLRVLAFVLASSLSLLTSNAQGYREGIIENPDRASGIYHYYEYAGAPLTKAPKGYKPFYISHYGRHGSRYHTGRNAFMSAMIALDSARTLNILTDEGLLLSRQMDTLWEEHQGMFGMLTERGGMEHRGIASRMLANYKDVFKGRKEVDIVSSTSPRCLISMDNFTFSLLENADKSRIKGLKLHFATGEKYMSILAHGASMSQELVDLQNKIVGHLSDSLIRPERLLNCIFSDPEKGKALVKDPSDFVYKIFKGGCISPNTDHHPDIFSHFTLDEMIDFSMPENVIVYYTMGISKEAGDCFSTIAKPLIKDFVEKADAAIADGSDRAADLRFGHDSGLLPLVGTLGIEGMEQRWPSATVSKHWASYEMIPMGSNFQMIFYRNRKGEVIVKMLYNEKETTIPALKPWNGPYYKWDVLREYFIDTMNAIPENAN